MRVLPMLLIGLLPVAGSAADWAWSWTPGTGEGVPAAAVTTFAYGKDWAYAIEIDDNPSTTRSFIAPFIAARGAWTDAPPALAGSGVRHAFVGTSGVIASKLGVNSAYLSAADLLTLRGLGWGVSNHSYWHAWSLTDAQVREDGFWSQAVLAEALGGRAPSSVIYANGLLDYDRDGWLAAHGMRVGTRVDSSRPVNVLSPSFDWRNVGRNVLDGSSWAYDDLVGGPATTPVAGDLIIDFGHDIDQSTGSANRQLWEQRLAYVGTWGADGSDRLWCAPTAEIADYRLAAERVTVAVSHGGLTLHLPDDAPGSRLTVRVDGLAADAALAVPAGGTLYRQGATAWVTTPFLGVAGSPPPADLEVVYRGSAADVASFPGGARRIAGVRVHQQGDAGTTPYRVRLQTAGGAVDLVDITTTAGWQSQWLLHARLPDRADVLATGLQFTGAACFTELEVWALRTAVANDPPTVSAGADRAAVRGVALALAGAASDDGLPSGSAMTVAWSRVSGPGAAVFAAAGAAGSTVTFDTAGTYVLRLTASDTALSAADDVTVTVADPVTPPIEPVEPGAEGGADGGGCGAGSFVAALVAGLALCGLALRRAEATAEGLSLRLRRPRSPAP